MPIELGDLRAALADRYAIERELGAGGMAVVYLADDQRHGRKVAVKVLCPEVAATLGADRFLREIQIAAGLTHPHVLPLYDSGQADGFLYYVTPYIDGETLRHKLRREGVLSLEDAARITAEVAGALEYAHAEGLIHRDIKPENILLSRGHAMVADFGMARAVEQAAGERLTRSGLAVGTPGYSSPEQAFGDGPIDGRTDVYSLGVVAYEMIGGDRPFSGSSPRAIFARMTTERPTSLRALRESVPDHVEAAVMQALAKLPADRWSTPEEFAAALQADGMVTPSPTSTISERLTRGLPQSTRARWVGAVALTAMTLGAVAWFWPGVGRGDDGRTVSGAALEAGLVPELSGPKVAVLPFTNLSGDPAATNLLNVVHQKIIDELGRGRDVRAIPRTSIVALSEAETRLPEIGERLGAAVVVEPSLTVSGDMASVVVRAIVPESEQLLWTEEYPSALADSAYLITQLPWRIAAEFRRALDPDAAVELNPPPDAPSAAVEAFLQGQEHLQESTGSRAEERTELAIESFRRAVEIYPRYAEAWAALGWAWEMAGGWFGHRSPHDAMPEANKAYERAIQLDSMLAEAHLGIATINFRYFWDWEKAEHEFRAAFRANPALARARDHYGNFLRAMRRFEESVAQLEKAVELDPLGPSWAELRQAYRTVGRFQEAQEAGERAKELDPSGLAARFSYALNLCEEGKMREGADSMAAWGGRDFAALMYASAGDEEEARRLLTELEEEGNVNHLPMSTAWVILGDTAKGLDLLELGLNQRHSHMVWLNQATHDAESENHGLCSNLPDIDLRGEPRYQAILDRLDFPNRRSGED